MASYAFRISGITPADSVWHLAGDDVHRSFWREVVRLVLIQKDAELAAGLDRHGRRMFPIAASTRRRGRWRSHTGQGTPDNPPLDPANELSRTRSLFTGRAHADHAEFFWRLDTVTGKPWGRILGYHREGSERLPVRDVIGLAPASLARVQKGADKWWAAWKRGHAMLSRVDLFEVRVPPPSGRPIPERPKIVNTDDPFRYATFGIGGSEARIRQAYAEGRLSREFLPGDPLPGGPAPRRPRPPRTPPAPPAPKPKPPTRPRPVVWVHPPRPIPGRPRGKTVKPPATPKPKPAPPPPPAPPKPPATIAERIAAYTAGDAKLAKIQAHGDVHAQLKAADEAARTAYRHAKERMTDADWDITNHAAKPKRDALWALEEKRHAAIEARAKAAAGAAAELLKILDVPVADRAKWTGSRIDALPDQIQQAAVDTMGIVARIVHGTGMKVEFEWKTFGPSDEKRAFHKGFTHGVAGGRHSTVTIGTETDKPTIAHELAHAVEWQIPGVHRRVAEFLAHRCGNEPAQKLADLFPDANYDPREMGRKDRFDSYFSVRSAYYCGKVYAHENSEIVAMGVQALFENPHQFAAKDPEYAKFILGILDGSIR